MSENQKQNIIDVNNMMYRLTNTEAEVIRELTEKMVDAKLLALVPDAILENMDVTEKLMMIEYYSKSEEDRKKDEEDAIPLEEALKKAGLTIDKLQD